MENIQLTELNSLSAYNERCKRAATAYLNNINSLECMNFCNDKAYWARMNAGALQVKVTDMLQAANKLQEKPMNPRLTYNDMKALKVGDLLRFQRTSGTNDPNPIDTVAVVTVPFGQVFDKQGNVASAVKVHCEPFGSFKLESVTSHNFHLFRKLS